MVFEQIFEMKCWKVVAEKEKKVKVKNYWKMIFIFVEGGGYFVHRKIDFIR